MYTGLIQAYNDLCGSSLSKDKVTVEIEASRYVGSDYAPMMQTNYYEKYIAARVTMEPRFVEMYRSSPGKFFKEYMEDWRNQSPNGDLLSGYLHFSNTGIELAKDSRAMITENGCGNPALIRFMDNLTAYLNGTWMSLKINSLRSAYSQWLNIGPLVSNNKDVEVPAIREAIKSKQFKLFLCTYLLDDKSQSNEYYWHAGAPTPPAEVVAYYDMVRPAVAECPAKVPPPLNR
jgi:hypothetical protein